MTEHKCESSPKKRRRRDIEIAKLGGFTKFRLTGDGLPKNQIFDFFLLYKIDVDVVNTLVLKGVSHSDGSFDVTYPLEKEAAKLLYGGIRQCRSVFVSIQRYCSGGLNDESRNTGSNGDCKCSTVQIQ